MHLNYQPSYDYGLPKIKVPGGYILYALFLPVIGLFLERYAYSAKVAIMLWVLVIILMPVSCMLDKKMLEEREINTITLGKTYLFPPLYIYKRQILIRGEAAICVACVVLLLGAAISNGFVKGLRITDKVAPEIVQSSYFTSLDNFSGSTNYTIGDCISSYSESEVRWGSEKTDYGFEVTVSGTHDDKEFEFVFHLEFDGFTYHDFYISQITEGGEELDKDGRSRVLDDCFIKYAKAQNIKDELFGDSSSSQEGQDA